MAFIVKRDPAPPPLITTSRAFDSSGGQVGSTITGNIPNNWIQFQDTVTSVIFANDNSVTSIGAYALNSTFATSLTIPNSVTSIGESAFAFCIDLSTITLPTNINFTSIETFMFINCFSLTTITIPNSVTNIGLAAFDGCTSLISITIPNSVTSIGLQAFGGCTSLISITIPSSVISIGDAAFRFCNSLSTVLCYAAQSAFTGNEAFLDTASPLTIRVPTSGPISDTWTAGTGLTFKGNTNVTVIKDL